MRVGILGGTFDPPHVGHLIAAADAIDALTLDRVVLVPARAQPLKWQAVAATPDQRPTIAKAAARFNEEDLTRFFQILLQTDEDLRRKPDPRVHLEMGLLRLINAARLAPLEELLAELKSGPQSGAANTGISRGAGCLDRMRRGATADRAVRRNWGRRS